MLQNMQHDLGLSSFTMEMNEFADMTADEFGAQRLGMRKRLKATVPEYSSGTLLNTSLAIEHLKTHPIAKQEWEWRISVTKMEANVYS